MREDKRMIERMHVFLFFDFSYLEARKREIILVFIYQANKTVKKLLFLFKNKIFVMMFVLNGDERLGSNQILIPTAKFYERLMDSAFEYCLTLYLNCE